VGGLLNYSFETANDSQRPGILVTVHRNTKYASMKDAKNISPVGWYVASYLLRFTERGKPNLNDPEARFLTWENTVLVKANNLDEAYDKTAKIGKQSTKPYRGGAAGVPIQWIFEGVTEILPIYEKIEDGSEIMWAEHSPRKLKSIRAMVRNKGEFCQ
jgi:hypothetical protein